MTLLLQTGGACDFDPGYLLDVWAGQRQRFVTVLQGFAPCSAICPPARVPRCCTWRTSSTRPSRRARPDTDPPGRWAVILGWSPGLYVQGRHRWRPGGRVKGHG